MGGIFICYRREDNRYAAGRLHDNLRKRFAAKQIFMDVDNVGPGESFPEVIRKRIQASDAILVVIGPNWLNSQDEDGARRLDDPDDFVRLEIEAGLNQGIRVIPVLIDRATMPRGRELPDNLKPLALLNAVSLSHKSFARDVSHLNSALAKIVTTPELERSPKQRAPSARRGRASADGGWKAGFRKRSWSHFEISFGPTGVEHLLQLDCSAWRIRESILLDGKVLETIWSPGHKSFKFTIEPHSNQFQLSFTASSLQRISQIELWVDDRKLLAAD